MLAVPSVLVKRIGIRGEPILPTRTTSSQAKYIIPKPFPSWAAHNTRTTRREAVFRSPAVCNSHGQKSITGSPFPRPRPGPAPARRRPPSCTGTTAITSRPSGCQPPPTSPRPLTNQRRTHHTTAATQPTTTATATTWTTRPRLAFNQGPTNTAARTPNKRRPPRRSPFTCLVSFRLIPSPFCGNDTSKRSQSIHPRDAIRRMHRC